MRKQLRVVTRFLRRIPFFAKLDWQVHLLRDLIATKFWTRTEETETPFGFRLATRVHPAYDLMKSGDFEPNETRIFLTLLGVAEAFVDVGANVGYYCCLALQRNKPVLAFEPQLLNIECLCRNLQSNGWEHSAEVFPVALSSSPGLLTLFGASGPSASLVKDWAGYSARFKQIVPVNTLDNMLASRFTDQQIIIKIDVEGAEFQVLEGALATIRRAVQPIWLIEVCFKEYHPSGENPDFLKIFQLFWDNGYECYGADDKCSPVRPEDVGRWLSNSEKELDTFNYVFVAPEVRLRQLIGLAADP